MRSWLSRISSANVDQSGEIIVGAGGDGHTIQQTKVFKTTSDTGFILEDDPPLAKFFPFGHIYTNGYFVSFGGNGLSP
jgi:hypothetical protein